MPIRASPAFFFRWPFLDYHVLPDVLPASVLSFSVFIELHFVQVFVLAFPRLSEVHEIPVLLHSQHFHEFSVLIRWPSLKLIVLAAVLFRASPPSTLESESYILRHDCSKGRWVSCRTSKAERREREGETRHVSSVPFSTSAVHCDARVMRFGWLVLFADEDEDRGCPPRARGWSGFASVVGREGTFSQCRERCFNRRTLNELKSRATLTWCASLRLFRGPGEVAATYSKVHIFPRVRATLLCCATEFSLLKKEERNGRSSLLGLTDFLVARHALHSRGDNKTR